MNFGNFGKAMNGDHSIGLGTGQIHNFNDMALDSSLNDHQRSNLFTAVFATNPTARSKEILEGMGGDIYSNLQGQNDFFGWTQGTNGNGFANGIINSAINGATRYLVGAMTDRIMRTAFGDFAAGSFLLDFFDINTNKGTSGINIYSVGLPDNVLSYEVDKNHNPRNIKILGREEQPLILRFRGDRHCTNLVAMNNWVDSVEDPVTGLRALPIDVEADIQVNLHTRAGTPHTVYMFKGCIPTSVVQIPLDYESRNEIGLFEVSFAFRSCEVGRVPDNIANQWRMQDLGGVIGDKVFGGSRIK